MTSTTDSRGGSTSLLAVGHLQALTAGLPDGYGVVLSVKDEHGLHRLGDDLVTNVNVDDLAVVVAKASVNADVYVSCTATTSARFESVKASGRGKRGGKEDAAALVAVWSDIDIAGPGHKSTKHLPESMADIHQILNTLPPASLRIGTGGGVHVWWLLDVPFVFDDDRNLRSRAERLADGWVRNVAHHASCIGFDIDQGVGDTSRVFRVCGTTNHKTDRPRPVSLLGDDLSEWSIDSNWRVGPSYTISELEALLDPLPVAAAAERASRSCESAGIAGRPSRQSRGSRDGLNILDIVNVMSWEVIWPDTMTFVGTEVIDGVIVELFVRDGAMSTYSVKCWPDQGCTVWSDNVPGLPAGNYSKADILAWSSGVTLPELARDLIRQCRDHLVAGWTPNSDGAAS